MSTVINQTPSKISVDFCCTSCDFNTSNKKDFNRHLQTVKHSKNICQPISTILPNAASKFECFCGKKYKDKSGLWRHKPKCNLIQVNNSNMYNEDPMNANNKLLEYLMKENSEFKEMLMEQNKLLMKMSENCGTHNIQHTNSHNKTFNLNLFLNETCKDAMNIMDFVESVKLDLSDLETVGTTGFVNGISNIIIKNLKGLDVTKRPLHCTDSKREVLYVKDENKWEKENDERDKMRKVINHISTKNIQQIPLWVDENPNCKDSESNKNTEYLHIVGQCMGCTEDKNFQKIIHNISKEVMVDK